MGCQACGVSLRRFLRFDASAAPSSGARVGSAVADYNQGLIAPGHRPATHRAAAKRAAPDAAIAPAENRRRPAAAPSGSRSNPTNPFDGLSRSPCVVNNARNVFAKSFRNLLLLLLLGLLLGACSSEEPEPEPEPEPEIPNAAFLLAGVETLDPLARPESPVMALERAAEIVELINDFYDIAFLDPERWDGGEHTGLADFFTTEAAADLPENLGNLALGELAGEIERVEPVTQDAERLTLYADDDGELSLGVITIVFQGVGETEREVPVRIGHVAHYWLEQVDGEYKISAYDALLAAAEDEE